MLRSTQQNTTQLTTDVLILGAGGAGLRAAIEARRDGVDVTVVSKMPATAPNCTSVAWGGLTYAPDSQSDELFRQVVETGGFLNNQDLVATFAEQTPKRIRELEEFGVSMEVLDSADQAERLGLTKVKGKKHNTGDGLTDGLRATAVSLDVRFLDQVMILSLSIVDGYACGAVGICLDEQTIVGITAKSTIIAGGGGAGLYARTDNPPGTTADGIALAYNAGAELVDLECVSFSVPSSRVNDLLSAKSPLDDDLLRIGAAHYFLGGIRIDSEARTTIPGLFAAGEATGGLFGAARLGGSAMADTIVFGAIAGEAAARNAQNSAVPGTDVISLEQVRGVTSAMIGDKGTPISQLVGALRETMWRYCGTLRNRETLEHALGELHSLPRAPAQIKVTAPSELREGMEFLNMLTVSELIVEGTLAREETRGCFWRLDFPAPDNPNWLRNSYQWKSNGKHHRETRPVVMSRWSIPTTPRIGAGCFSYLPTTSERTR